MNHNETHVHKTMRKSLSKNGSNGFQLQITVCLKNHSYVNQRYLRSLQMTGTKEDGDWYDSVHVKQFFYKKWNVLK